MTSIYCDYCATTPLIPEVQEAMAAHEATFFGNPSSVHQFGQRSRTALEKYRKTVTSVLGCSPQEIIFTSGGTESNNTVFQGVLKPGDHVITSQIEHPSVLTPLNRLSESGITVTRIAPEPTGEIDPGSVTAALRADTRLVTIMALNNETGVINDLGTIGKVCRDRNIPFHTDAVQAVGKLPLDVNRDGITFLSASAHKLGGPKGTGLLYVQQGAPIESLLRGGSQENNHRSGTENLAGAAGFAKAVEIAVADLERRHKKMAHLRPLFLEALEAEEVEFRVNGRGAYPGILNLRFPGLSGQAVMMNLDLSGIAVSYGSACASGSPKPSSVLLAMGLDPQAAAESVRISFGPPTTEDEVRTVAQTLGRVTRQLHRDYVNKSSLTATIG